MFRYSLTNDPNATTWQSTHPSRDCQEAAGRAAPANLTLGMFCLTVALLTGGCPSIDGGPLQSRETPDETGLGSILRPRDPLYFHHDTGVLTMFDWIAEPEDWEVSNSLNFVSINGRTTYTSQRLEFEPSGNVCYFTFEVSSTLPEPFCGHLSATVGGKDYDKDFCY